MPAYNAEKTLEKTVQDIPPGTVSDIVLVDDASRDKTAEVARSLGLAVIVREKNGGYGANQKTCYAEALRRGADVVIMIHPDYQYDARLAPIMAQIISSGICDVVLGNRIRTRAEALAGGMPLYKYLFNRLLTVFENLLTGQNLGEWHSGLRAYSRKVLETVRWDENSDDFVFDQQFLLQSSACGFKIGDVPVSTRYFPEASSINFRRSMVYGLSTLLVLSQYLLCRTGVLRLRRFSPKS
ncbi:MAG: glycosyltransferase family 2 protein [Elusimicrobia bacterium]|nr:glycosyltransferase family 2 protein [Elusimicrobiota bacterium]MDE2313670.1 glycosyltransferase family 2 protein [Elusimicrobiota bacterium]